MMNDDEESESSCPSVVSSFFFNHNKNQFQKIRIKNPIKAKKQFTHGEVIPPKQGKVFGEKNLLKKSMSHSFDSFGNSFQGQYIVHFEKRISKSSKQNSILPKFYLYKLEEEIYQPKQNNINDEIKKNLELIGLKLFNDLDIQIDTIKRVIKLGKKIEIPKLLEIRYSQHLAYFSQIFTHQKNNDSYEIQKKINQEIIRFQQSLFKWLQDDELFTSLG